MSHSQLSEELFIRYKRILDPECPQEERHEHQMVRLSKESVNIKIILYSVIKMTSRFSLGYQHN